MYFIAYQRNIKPSWIGDNEVYSKLIVFRELLFIGTSILFLIFKDLNFVDDTIHIPLAPLIFGTGFFYVEVFC